MTNAEKFEQIFGIYATELWAKPELEFLEWLNNNYYLDEESQQKGKCFKCTRCNNKYYTTAELKWDESGYNYWVSICPKCGTENEINNCYWR